MQLPVESDTLRTVVGTVVLFAALVAFTEATIRSFAPVLLPSASMLIYEIADDVYDLPDGTSWTVYGLGLVAAGAALVFSYTVWLGVTVFSIGGWFVLDGATTIRYGPARTPHEFVSGPEDEAMLRMQIMNKAHQNLRNTTEPQTVEELAESCDLTESRVESALNYMEQRSQVSHTEEGYRAKPQRWGRATPVARFLFWLPRRTFRPFKRMFYNDR